MRWLRRLLDWWEPAIWWCSFRGHDQFLKFAVDRLCLRCASCGHESPGWHLPTRLPVPLRPRVVRFRKRLRVVA